MMEELARRRCIDCDPLGASPSSNTSSYFSVGLSAAILTAIEVETKCQWPGEGCRRMTRDLSYDGQLAGSWTYLAVLVASRLGGDGCVAKARPRLQAALGSFQLSPQGCLADYSGHLVVGTVRGSESTPLRKAKILQMAQEGLRIWREA